MGIFFEIDELIFIFFLCLADTFFDLPCRPRGYFQSNFTSKVSNQGPSFPESLMKIGWAANEIMLENFYILSWAPFLLWHDVQGDFSKKNFGTKLH
jgi:hypothetical protein